MKAPRSLLRQLAASGTIALAMLLSVPGHACAQDRPAPVYVRVDSGWLGLFGHGGEYARFPVVGRQVQLQDAAHILVTPSLGLMVTFVDSADVAGPDPLAAHARWEADYWREHAARVDTTHRLELEAGRRDVRVTQLTIWNARGEKLAIYLVGLRAADGVYAFAFSPATPAAGATVARFVKSLRIVHHPLTAAEVAQISRAAKQ